MPIHREERQATPDERNLMRAFVREHGASLRQPWAWLRNLFSGCVGWPVVWMLTAFFMLFTLVPAWIAFQAARPLFNPDTWLWLEGHLLRGAGLFALFAPPIFALINRRRALAPMAADAFPGKHVEVWSVRGATAARHEMKTWRCSQACPDGTGDSLYFDFDGGDVFCLSGDDWRAFTQTGTSLSTLRIEGSFPSTDFDVVVMPRCRKAIRVVGRGESLPMGEYVYEAQPVAMDFSRIRDKTLGVDYEHPEQHGQVGAFRPYQLPWKPIPTSAPVPPNPGQALSAAFILRPATEDERHRMRERAIATGAILKAFRAWARRLWRSLPNEWILPFYALLLAGYVLESILAMLLMFIFRWPRGVGYGNTGYWATWIIVPGLALLIAGIRYWRWSRSIYRPIRVDAGTANDAVEVWTVHTRGAAHLLRGGFEENEFSPQKRGSCLYFDLADGEVLALEGADWIALARGLQPEDLRVEGAFPSDEFELVVAPKSRRILTVIGRGQPLPFREWMDRWGDEAPAHRAFREARDAIRRRAHPWKDQVAVFRPPAKPWNEDNHV